MSSSLCLLTHAKYPSNMVVRERHLGTRKVSDSVPSRYPFSGSYERGTKAGSTGSGRANAGRDGTPGEVARGPGVTALPQPAAVESRLAGNRCPGRSGPDSHATWFSWTTCSRVSWVSWPLGILSHLR